jgi:NADPH:quinone reductase-like Zn-dependent oxidoreductase
MTESTGSMKAMAITRLGGPEVIQARLVDRPHLAQGEVLVQVQATAYNRIDTILREIDLGIPFPIVPGSDVVGTVVSGRGRFSEGENVVINPGLPCTQCDKCMMGGRCRYVKILGVARSGGYAEYVAVPESQCFPVPHGVSVQEAAGFPLDFLTAWRMLVTRAKASPDQVALVWGASGGLGSAGVSIASSLGMQVLAVVRRSSHVEPLLVHGADRVIDTSSERVDEVVNAVTDQRGVDVVFEGPGAPTWETSINVVSQGGVIVTAGVTGGSHANLDLEDLYYRQISILGSRMGYPNEFAAAHAMWSAGKCRPLISRVLPIADALRAHALAEAGDRCGKLILIYDD